MTGSMLDEVKAAGWRERRACADVPPSVFFPDSGGTYHGDRAKRICAACPVQPDCLKFAVDNAERTGIWGGMDRRERLRWQRETGYVKPRRPVVHGTSGYRGGCRCRVCRAANAEGQRRRRERLES